MTPKLEEILGTQPNSVDINPQVLALLGQFGNRVERLTARTLSVEERKIVDARLCTLALDLRDSAGRFEEKRFHAIIGDNLLVSNDENFLQVA